MAVFVSRCNLQPENGKCGGPDHRHSRKLQHIESLMAAVSCCRRCCVKTSLARHRHVAIIVLAVGVAEMPGGTPRQLLQYRFALLDIGLALCVRTGEQMKVLVGVRTYLLTTQNPLS